MIHVLLVTVMLLCASLEYEQNVLAQPSQTASKPPLCH
jgi:hypothetical protein